ncbi:MAG: hypothetical protein IPI04_02865 [Ignavibacteria bacterium]|nr:hypothetical protein [Ignavibacteria bacterium]
MDKADKGDWDDKNMLNKSFESSLEVKFLMKKQESGDSRKHRRFQGGNKFIS